MNKKRWLGLALFVVGIIFILDSNVGITGFVVAETASVGIGTLIGLAFVIGGIGLLMSREEGNLERQTNYSTVNAEYFIKRAKEITRHKGDVYISQWEVNGLLNELKDEGYRIEHGTDNPAIHFTSPFAPRILHYHIEKGKKEGKHLYVTKDPNDPRLKYAGIREINGGIKRVPSKVYFPEHPRISGKEKKDFTKNINLPVHSKKVARREGISNKHSPRKSSRF